MSSTPPGGYRPGDYVPFRDRDPNNPDHHRAPAAGPEDPYRAIYGYDAPDRVRLAGWGRRVLAYLFDTFLACMAGAPLFVGYYQLLANLETTTDVNGEQTITSVGEVPETAWPLVLIGGLLYFAFFVYNWCIRQGRTGYTFGKSVVGIKLVAERSKLPIGAGMSFLRQLAHIVDGLICNLGYLWPIWDSKKQTFADKIMGTLVIIQPQDQPQDPAGYRAQG
jgi:uncharacterized RDD family membrane protein YckC